MRTDETFCELGSSARQLGAYRMPKPAGICDMGAKLLFHKDLGATTRTAWRPSRDEI